MMSSPVLELRQIDRIYQSEAGALKVLQGVDLTLLSASGPHGRVTEQDVMDYKNGTGRFAAASTDKITSGETRVNRQNIIFILVAILLVLQLVQHFFLSAPQ